MATRVNAYHRHVTLADILTQCADRNATVHTMPVRAEWFRVMLNNACLNARDSIARLEQYQPVACHGAIVAHTARIARCQLALRQIEGVA